MNTRREATDKDRGPASESHQGRYAPGKGIDLQPSPPAPKSEPEQPPMAEPQPARVPPGGGTKRGQ
jgi:hypothetical protein